MSKTIIDLQNVRDQSDLFWLILESLPYKIEWMSYEAIENVLDCCEEVFDDE